jgi:DNA (cytosine-5)-methyltransferase 1
MQAPNFLYQDYSLNRRGFFVPERLAKRRPTCIDLFAGAGGFSLGMKQAGFEVVAALDFDIHCMVTYLVNLGAYPVQIHFAEPEDKDKFAKYLEKKMKKFQAKHSVDGLPFYSGSGWIKDYPDIPGTSNYFYGDIRKFSGAFIMEKLGVKPGEIDCIVGGPPCQGFSMSGKRDIMDPRNSLVFEFADKILEIQPKSFIMENVPGILSMVTPEGLPVIDAFSLRLAKGGYGTYEALKRSLLATAGLGAAVKGSSHARRKTEGKMELW